MQCSRLLKLDLSNNGISALPKREDWARLPELQVLYLHGNQLGSLKTAGRLAALPKLVRATFFDNPLATHQNYRHFLVNSIFSLRALDRLVVSMDADCASVVSSEWHGPSARQGNPTVS